MKEISEKVGMTKGSFYHHFKSKEEIFSEIIHEYFLDNLSSIAYESFSQNSLKQFYLDYLQSSGKVSKSLFNEQVGAKEESSVNPLVLLFEAFRILPEVKTKVLQLYSKEQKAWEKVIRRAKENQEIKSSMPDRDIAKMFIYLNDGCGLRYLQENKTLPSVKKDLLPIYNGIYEMLKV